LSCAALDSGCGNCSRERGFQLLAVARDGFLGSSGHAFSGNQLEQTASVGRSHHLAGLREGPAIAEQVTRREELHNLTDAKQRLAALAVRAA
jgi:hypothetical protein